MSDVKKENSPEANASGENDSSSGDFESSLAVLESLVERLEAEQLGLDESLALYEKGMGLAQRCQTLLEDARQKVELMRDAGSEPESFDVGESKT